MPQDQTTETTPKYAEASDVAAELLKPDNYFTANTVPSVTRLNKMIMQAEEFVDSQLRRSWRNRKRTNEFINGRMNQIRHARAGFKFILDRDSIKELNANEGDVLEVWNGTEYVDYLANKEEGRNKDFWLDYEAGILYLNSLRLIAFENIIRITYRYGESQVPLDITDAVAKMVAIKILTNEDNSFILNDAGNDKAMMYDPRISIMKQSIKQTLMNYSNNIFVL